MPGRPARADDLSIGTSSASWIDATPARIMRPMWRAATHINGPLACPSGSYSVCPTAQHPSYDRGKKRAEQGQSAQQLTIRIFVVDPYSPLPCDVDEIMNGRRCRTSLTRMIHEPCCCNRQSAATASLQQRESHLTLHRAARLRIGSSRFRAPVSRRNSANFRRTVIINAGEGRRSVGLTPWELNVIA